MKKPWPQTEACLTAAVFLLWLLACLLPATTLAETKADRPSSNPPRPGVSFADVADFPAMIASGRLHDRDIPNPHWQADGCIACHTGDRKTASAKNLRDSDIEKVCYNCHDPAFDHRYIHPVRVNPDRQMLAGMSAQMRAELATSGNTITCTTCHDLRLQCLAEHRQTKVTNPAFFRNGPYESRSQLCFGCHDRSAYQRLDPHDQVDEHGRLREEKCPVCHADGVRRLRQVSDIGQLTFQTEYSLSTLCWGCHPWTPHPGGQFTFFKNQSGPNHLITPPQRIRQRMQKTTQEKQQYFPLEPENDRIFCATCHNVHEKGVIADPVKSRGADSRKRLRDQDICEYCHLK